MPEPSILKIEEEEKKKHSRNGNTQNIHNLSVQKCATFEMGLFMAMEQKKIATYSRAAVNSNRI